MKKHFLIISLAILAIVLVLVFIFANKKDTTKLTEAQQASIQFSWIPSGTFGGDAAGIVKFAKEYNLDLTGRWGGPGVNPIQIVQSNQSTFGHMGADEVLAANDKGADFVILGVINQNSLGGFISLADKNILTPKDLEGKRVGILPYGNTTMVYENMLSKNNVDRKKINEITISNDLKPFLSGVYDVHPVFINDETVDFESQHISYNLIEPKDFGINIKGLVYFTKRETLEKNPELVKAFVNTMADGWNYAVKNPESAIQMLKEIGPETNIERETQVLKKGIPYFTAYNNQTLNSDTESWNAMVETLKQSGVIKNNPDLPKVLQFRFINEYYK